MSSDYPAEFVARLELLWGAGFLSPGGPDEVREIVADLSVTGKSILDVGCGLGGPDIVLVRDLGALSVTGIDIDEGLVERAQAFADANDLSNRLHYKVVRPGPLEWPADTFDLVFSKEAIIQVSAKKDLLCEIHRVLRDGSAFAWSDWLGGTGWAASPEWAKFSALTHWESHLTTVEEAIDLMRSAGFRDVKARDRNEWYCSEKRAEIARLEGSLRADLTALMGKDAYEKWLEVNRANLKAVDAGALRPVHLRGWK